MSDEDFRRVDAAARVIATGWWNAAPGGAFLWRDINLGECFAYDLRFVARDILKADLAARRAIERFAPDVVSTDVPPISETFPSYPYMAGIGSLLEGLASTLGFPLQRLYATKQTKGGIRPALILRAYGVMASRKALSHLRSEHPLVGVGPFRETYAGVARAWSVGDGVMVVVSSLKAPLRADPSGGLYFAPFEAFLTSKERGEVQSFIDKCVESVPVALPPHTSYAGSKQSESVFLVDVQRRLRQQLGDVIPLCLAFEKGLDRASRLLLMETHSPVSKAAVRCGRRRGIPIIVIQHGVIADPESYRETDADRIAAWGPLDAAWFSSNQPDGVLASPTGNPRYDLLSNISRSSTHPALKGVPRGMRRVLFASAPFGHLKASTSLWDHEALQSAVVEALSGIQEAFLLFKRHPAERPGQLAFGSDAEHRRVLEVVGGETLALIRSSELVITLGSTVALEAMYLDRPAVFLGPSDPQSPFHPPEDGAGLRARDRGELEDQVRRLLRDSAYRDQVLLQQRIYLQRCFAPLDGRAAERVSTLLR